MLLKALDQSVKIERTIRLFGDREIRRAIANSQQTIATDNHYIMILVGYYNYRILFMHMRKINLIYAMTYLSSLILRCCSDQFVIW